MEIIESFRGEHEFLSNFSASPVEWEGEVYPTVEHAFQAAKLVSPEDRLKVRLSRSPVEAKQLGKRLPMRSDWNQHRLGVMETLVRQKFFNHQELTALLLKTGDAELAEGNIWGDRFWGVCRGENKNHLGRILMKVRSELRTRTNCKR